MLLHSLRMSADATAGKPEALQEISARAKTHDRDHLNIKPELYRHWLDAAVETAQESDELWNVQVESAWKTTLGFVVEHMIRKF